MSTLFIWKNDNCNKNAGLQTKNQHLQFVLLYHHPHETCFFSPKLGPSGLTQFQRILIWNLSKFYAMQYNTQNMANYRGVLPSQYPFCTDKSWCNMSVNVNETAFFFKYYWWLNVEHLQHTQGTSGFKRLNWRLLRIFHMLGISGPRPCPLSPATELLCLKNICSCVGARLPIEILKFMLNFKNKKIVSSIFRQI